MHFQIVLWFALIDIHDMFIERCSFSRFYWVSQMYSTKTSRGEKTMCEIMGTFVLSLFLSNIVMVTVCQRCAMTC